MIKRAASQIRQCKAQLSPMEADDEILAFFKFNWFCSFILNRSLRPPPPPPEDEFPVITAGSLSPERPPTTMLVRHRCSSRDESALSPEAPIQTRSLHNIPSEKVTIKDSKPIRQPAAAVGEIRERRMRRDRYRRGSKKVKYWGSKSLSDLEFEELKGFMDLGFTFSDAEASDPWLISIVPGLQRLRPANGTDSPSVDSSLVSETTDEIVVARPYLSEAWEVEEVEEERRRVLKSWKTPAEGEGVNLKDQLRFWAHAVASTVL